MDHSLAALAALCAATPLAGGLLPGLLLAGLAGSAIHCVPMCGPFVLGQVADRMARVPAVRLCELQRVGGGLLLPYHVGRITTYAGLGALTAAIGSALSRLPWLGRLSGLLLLVAALLFLCQALRRLVPALHALLPDASAAPHGFVRLIAGLTGRLDRSTPLSGLLLGLALGFLPCGFLYAALTAASASGGPATGALAMVAFGLGTVPSLVAVGIAGQAAGRRWQRGAAAVAPAVMLLNAVLLTVLALRGIA
ncbi:MAG TPA: sulfite exporter TauE/SafE family protein [Acetobacteraceae bacterium]|nr:sulfite exporter TauE/SafE family protein [Acetobacteraceae bacterium]